MSQASRAGGREASLYVHVPFCCAKCKYCAFYSVIASDGAYDDYLAALAIEWDLMRAEEADLADAGLSITSIYVGGGTPSILGGDRLARLLETLRKGPSWANDCEISLEVNPESTDRELATRTRSVGFNRVSVGVQSFRDEELEILGRVSRAADARRAIEELRGAGFENLNIDLIYGLPGQTTESWLASLHEALGLRSAHLSSYMLTPEEDTVMHRLLRGGMLATPLEETVLHHYRALVRTANDAGLEHYEISNFARPGFRCRHNLGTWRRRPYYGLGPAAHSFDGAVRWQNAAHLATYQRQLLGEGRRPTCERYRLGEADAVKEMIILGLRLAEGVVWAEIDAAATPEQSARLRHRAQFLAATGFVLTDDERLRLSPAAYFVSNAVFVELVRALEEGEE
jgi:oxygen-independent coproporphyrinogen III oxidase